jgi:putative endonuclease
MFYLYAISSLKRNYIYVGLTNNIVRRTQEHNSGYNKTTKPYLPLELIYQKTFDSRAEARAHEKEMKTSQGKRILRNLLPKK